MTPIIGLLVAAALIYAAGFVGNWFTGWSKLGKRLRYNNEFVAEKWSWCNIFLRGFQYKHIVTLGVAQEGLYMRVARLYSAGAPDLMIPWSEMTAFERRRVLFLFPIASCRIGSVEQIKMSVPPKLADKIEAARKQHFPTI